MTRIRRVAGALAVVALALPAASYKYAITPDVQAALNHISAADLRGHLSFLASDALEGRLTPSAGLDIAAEYIASEFRRVGLEPAGDDGYFQTAPMHQIQSNFEGFTFQLTGGGKTVSLTKEEVAARGQSALDLKDAAVVKVNGENAAKLTPEEIAGKVALVDERGRRRYMASLRRLKPALVIAPAPARPLEELRSAQLSADDEPPQGPPLLYVQRHKFHELASAAGASAARVSMHLAAPIETPLKLRNVAGLLRGSDPALKKTYILLTAHYDHIGTKSSGEGDRIYNGANDDGSGTVSVIEIANALARLKTAPKRSILFMTFFGEEEGGFGSEYYERHPLVPLADTIADVNLEQLGRTDSTEGPQVGTATFTGFDYSDLPEIFQAAGSLTGIKVYKDGKGSDDYFSRSDNQELADAGVPSHTLAVAFDFPDYHGVGDEWRKIDYENMARVDRMVAVGLLMLAGDAPPPEWNPDNSKASEYLRAWKKLHPGK